MADIRDTIARYVKTFSAGDRDGWLACWREDATMEDPVGTPVKHGHAELGAFFEQTMQAADSVTLTVAGEPIVIGDEAVFNLNIVAVIGGARMGMPAIDVMRFDSYGLIAAQRAFVDFGMMAPLPAA